MLSSSGTNGGLQKPLRLRRVNHSDEIVTGFSKLLKTESMTDVTLICSGGQTIRAHRVILSTFSPYFRAIFESQPFSNNPCQYPVIVIKDLALSELRTIVEFIYKGEVSVSRDKLSAVLQAAKELEVSGLSDFKVDGHSSSSTSSSASPSINSNINSHHHSINGDIEVHSVRHHVISSNNGGSIWKRSHDASSMDHSSSNHHGSVNSLFGLGYEAQLKKSRVTLEGSDGIGMSVTNALLGDNGSSMVNHDSVRSLLHQPNRISQELQNIRSLQSLSSLNKQRHLTVEQLLHQKQQHIHQRQLIQQKLRAQQQQHQIKQQLLQQQQQMIQKNVSSKSLLQRFNSSPQRNESSFNQFQEKIKAQMAARNSSIEQAKEETSEDNNKCKQEKGTDELNESEGKNQPEIIEDETVDIDGDGAEEAEDLTNANGEEDNAGSKEGSDERKETDEERRSKNRRKNSTPRNVSSDDVIDSDSVEQGDEGRKNNDEMYSNGEGVDDDDDGPVILKATIDDVSDYIDEDDINEDNDDYESNGGGIDRDVIFQRQQHLRLQQLQQQQKYQQQIQLQMLQEQQEAKLIELHQQLQHASGTNDTNGPDQDDDSSPGLSLDWQEGFTDESFPMITDLRTGTNGNDQDKSNSGATTANGKPATPDFLQPRGPGRPRKGNKSNDISPCPECNKVFVRPDVLKLHYRSVHLNERHPCNMCPKIFKWPGDLSKHKRTKHPDQMAALNNQKNNSSNS